MCTYRDICIIAYQAVLIEFVVYISLIDFRVADVGGNIEGVGVVGLCVHPGVFGGVKSMQQNLKTEEYTLYYSNVCLFAYSLRHSFFLSFVHLFMQWLISIHVFVL